MIRKLSFMVAMFSGLTSSFGTCPTTTGDPSALKIKVYAVAVSSNKDCSSPKLVSQYAGGQEFDFEANPTIMTGSVSDGTYPCVILLMSDKLKVVPKTTFADNVCVAGTEYTQSVCQDHGGGNHQYYTPMTIAADNTISYGTKTACTGDEVVPLFLSTTSPNPAGHNLIAFEQPISTNSECGADGTGCGIQLSNAFSVSGAVVGTFVVDFTGKLDEQGDTTCACSVEAPTFNFR